MDRSTGRRAALAAPARVVPVAPRREALRRLLAAVVDGAEATFVALALFAYTGALLPLVFIGTDPLEDPSLGSPALRAIYAGLYALNLVFLARRWKLVRAVLLNHVPTLALVGLAVASVTWSTAPDLTLRRGIALVGTTMFGIYLAARFRPPALLSWLAWIFGLIALLSIASEVGLLPLPYEEGEGGWHGVYTHKNALGRSMTLAAVVYLLASRRIGSVVSLVAFATAVIVLLLSGSKSGVVILLTFAALLPLFTALRVRDILVVPILCAAVLLLGVAGQWVVFNSESILQTLGKDVTLTGRTTLWMAVLAMVAQRPWTGYGYGAFWLGESGASAGVWEAVRWRTPHAHNGFLDLSLDLGLIGLVLFLAGAATALFRATSFLRAERGGAGMWPLAYLSFLLLYNVTESAILKQNSIFWVLYVAMVFSLPAAAAARSRASARAPAAPGRAAVTRAARARPPIRCARGAG